jgi:hypothetical protein
MTHKELPDKDLLRIWWTVATSSALEGQGEAYVIFARFVREYLFDIDPPYKLHHYPNSHDPDETPHD